ncbi:MAG: hypothetical protein MJY71_07060 [Bacteroidaceae bacterium]|nr:hypothetical protein [Bacteroidaceae bacterium]
MRRLHTLFMLLAISAAAIAKEAVVELECDSINLLIGDQTKVHLSVTCDKGAQVSVPEYKSYIVPGLEIIPPVESDTQFINFGQRMTINMHYTVTAFDTSMFYIPPTKVFVDSVEYKATHGVPLMVYAFPIDTTSYSIFGHKEQLKEPIIWKDLDDSVLSILLIALFVTAFVYLLNRYKKDKPILKTIKIEKKEPAHIVAKNAIENIREQKLQHGSDAKAYYSQLTDIIKVYIEDRFGFNATDMTSDQIIDNLKNSADYQGLKEFSELLQTADLVKFAKYTPMLNENDMFLEVAQSFIQDTFVQTEPVEQQPVEQVIQVCGMSKKEKLIVLTLTAIAAVVAVAAFVYLMYRIYILFF